MSALSGPSNVRARSFEANSGARETARDDGVLSFHDIGQRRALLLLVAAQKARAYETAV